MKKILLAIATLMVCFTMNAQTLLEEGFNNGIPSDWVLWDDGNTPNSESYQAGAWVFVSAAGNPAPCIGSQSWLSGTVVAQCDKWIVTSAVTIPETGFAFSLEAMAYEAPNYPDGFEVRVCTGTPNSRADFESTPLISVAACSDNFEEYSASLDAYVGQTVYFAIIQNSTDMNVLWVDNVKVFKPSENEINMVSLNMPEMAAMGGSLTVQGTIMSKGILPLNSFVLSYTVNGGEAVSETISGLNVAYGETYNFTASTPVDIATAGSYAIEVTISLPNGVDDASPANNSASSSVFVYDGSLAVDRTVVIEQFTGNQCGWCPSGHDRLMSALGQFSGDYVYITHHAGFNQDALTTEYDTGLTGLYGGSTFAPAMGIDRTRFNDEEDGPVGSIYDVNDNLDVLNRALAVPSFVEVSISDVNFDEATRKVTGTVSGQFKDQALVEGARLTVYLLEDSIVMTQSDYVNGTQSQYRHMNTCRTSLTGVWGEAPSVAADGSFTYNIDYTLPEVVTTGQAKPMNVPYRTHVVAFVSHYNASNVLDCKVYNAAKSPKLNGNHVNINDVAEVSVSLYPNPATDYVVLQSNCQMQEVMIVNTLGQVVYTNSQVNNSEMVISTTDLPAGLYIATVKSQNGISTQRFTVAR